VIVIISVSEIAKRSSVFGALIAALPLTSLLAIIWMRVEKVETEKIAQLSRSIFWLVLPSLAFFLVFPLLLQKGISFWASLGLSATLTIAIYVILLWFFKASNATML
jgi:predicted permease